jgi:hypothetical protein
MPTLTFEGETHGEIVVKVRRWLASLEGDPTGQLSPAEAITQGAEVTKEALRVIASSAPGPIAQSDLIKTLTRGTRRPTVGRCADEQPDGIEEATARRRQVTGASRKAAGR